LIRREKPLEGVLKFPHIPGPFVMVQGAVRRA
jgi:hypothetical protein